MIQLAKKRGGVLIEELRGIWPLLSSMERLEGFRNLRSSDVENFFLNLRPQDQLDILDQLPEIERRFWTRFLPADAVADIIQKAPDAQRELILNLLDDVSRKEVTSLLAYAEDDAGGLMNPGVIRLGPDMGVDEAIIYVKKQTREKGRSIFYLYGLDSF